MAKRCDRLFLSGITNHHPALESLTFEMVNIGADMEVYDILARPACLPELRSLKITGDTRIWDESGLVRHRQQVDKVVHACTGLTSLQLPRDQAFEVDAGGGGGLVGISGLRRLSIIPGQLLDGIASLTLLERLELHNLRLAAAAEQLELALGDLPKLRVLRLHLDSSRGGQQAPPQHDDYCANLEEAAERLERLPPHVEVGMVLQAVSRCGALLCFQLDGISGLTDTGVAALPCLQQLASLSCFVMDLSGLTDAGLAAAVHGMPRLHYLNIRQVRDTDAHRTMHIGGDPPEARVFRLPGLPGRVFARHKLGARVAWRDAGFVHHEALPGDD